MLKSLKLRD